MIGSYLRTTNLYVGISTNSTADPKLQSSETRDRLPTIKIAKTKIRIFDRLPSRTRGVVVEYALALAKEVPEGADLLLLLALRQLVDVLVAALPVRRLDEDRDERAVEVAGVGLAE